MAKTKASSDLFDIMKTRLEGIRKLLDDMDESVAEQLIQMLLHARRIFATGKGRSGYIADSFAMRLMQMGFDAHVPGEATCPCIRRGDVMVAVSCSGTTATTVQFARISRDSGAQVVAVTAVADSPLASIAHLVVLVPVTERDVKKSYRYVLGPHNNTLFEEALLLYFDGMVYSMLTREGISKDLLSRRHTNLE
jgi:6-phospho-3-hexuloisomerase